MAGLQIIAEAGVNHNGDADVALRLVDAAADAGADWVKFQTFRTENLTTRAAPKAAYQKVRLADDGENDGQFDMLKSLELDADNHRRLVAHCRQRGIGFLSTPFDLESLTFLIDELGVGLMKIGSGDLTNAPLLLELGRRGLPLYLSTGMSDMAMIRFALGVLAFGYTKDPNPPGIGAFVRALNSDAGRAALSRSVTLLHCVSAYPAPIEDIGLAAIPAMSADLGLAIGYSDHTQGTAVAVAAVALGATVIEKHLTLDRSWPGPDHAMSLDPETFSRMVGDCREAAAALGTAEKQVKECEREVIAVARKSLVARTAIKAGDRFDAKNLTTKRPGTGVDAQLYFDWIGRTAGRDYLEDELIDE